MEVWPAYLFKRLPHNVRLELRRDAKEQDLSLGDIVRAILCARYKLDCLPASTAYRKEIDKNTGMLYLRLQPELKAALAAEAKISARPMRSLILDSLKDHYALKEAA